MPLTNVWAKREEERENHRKLMESKYGVVGHPKAKKLYDFAWEFGHACGFHEVEFYYSQMVELIHE